MKEPIYFNNSNLRRLFNLSLSRNTIRTEHFDTSRISTITHNEFTPIVNFSAFKEVDGIIIYPEISFNNAYLYKDAQKYLLIRLVNRHSGISYIEYTEKGELKKIYVGHGFILNEQYDFLFLASLRGHLLKESVDIYDEDTSQEIYFTKRDVKIFMTNDFINNHRRFYNLLKREILQDYLESGCELSITDSDVIKDSVYGNEFERDSNFVTVEDKVSFIEEFRNTILEYEQ